MIKTLPNPATDLLNRACSCFCNSADCATFSFFKKPYFLAAIPLFLLLPGMILSNTLSTSRHSDILRRNWASLMLAAWNSNNILIFYYFICGKLCQFVIYFVSRHPTVHFRQRVLFVDLRKKNQTRNYFPNMRRRKGKYEAAHTSTTWLGCRILQMWKNTLTNFPVHFVSKRICTSSRAPLWTSRAPPPAAIAPSGRRNTWRLKQGWANSGKIARNILFMVYIYLV